MGKVGNEQSHSTAADSQATERNARYRCRVCGFFRFRCVFALLLGVGVLLSALFWLPPFFRHQDQGDLDLDYQFRDYDIVASFMLKKPVTVLEDNILRLEDDIFEEIQAPTIKVEVISMKVLAGTNITKVVFAVVPDEKNTRVSSTALSLVRASFVPLIIQQYPLRLTVSLFGDPFSFEVLKFRGGITVIPLQSAFVWQQVQLLFNFTLNFSIDQIQHNFDELTSQLKSGIHLSPYENLYIKLTNYKGSTMAPPTTVQTSVLLAIGNPSLARSKQLAQTITNSHAKNLGLNNTVFGRVKQVRLSSMPRLGDDASPTPAPSPHLHHHHHHHHHHHRHHHHQDHISPSATPEPSTNRPTTGKGPYIPSPALSPEREPNAKPPGCQFGHQRRWPRKQSHHNPPALPPVPQTYPPSPSPVQPVKPHEPVPYHIPASSPLPRVIYAHVQPPRKSGIDAEAPRISPSVSPSSSSAGLLPTTLWIFLQLLLVTILHLGQL